MTDRINMAAEPRIVTGKKAKQLRRDGWIPAVIYGQQDVKNIQLENLQLRRVLREAGTTHLIDIELRGRKHTVLAKELQVHPTRGELIHVDFFEVNMMEKIVVDAELVSVGNAAPAESGLGSVSLVIHSVEIECLPDNLISEIEVDLTRIETPDDMIFVSDLSVPEGVTILTDPEMVVARFEYAQVAEEEEVEGEEFMFAQEADEVEVISKGKQEEDFD